MTNEIKTSEQTILEAAEREFMTKGYAGAKTTSIAAAAGVTHAMLHYYFRTKENLFNKVFDEKIRLMGSSIINSFADTQLPIKERITAGIKAHFDFLANNADLPLFVVNELISKPERREIITQKIAKIAGAVIANLQQELDLEAERGTIDKINAMDIMLDIVSLNVFVFVAYPILETFAVVAYGGREKFLEARKRENVTVIMRRLTKK